MWNSALWKVYNIVGIFVNSDFAFKDFVHKDTENPEDGNSRLVRPTFSSLTWWSLLWRQKRSNPPILVLQMKLAIMHHGKFLFDSCENQCVLKYCFHYHYLVHSLRNDVHKIVFLFPASCLSANLHGVFLWPSSWRKGWVVTYTKSKLFEMWNWRIGRILLGVWQWTRFIDTIICKILLQLVLIHPEIKLQRGKKMR